MRFRTFLLAPLLITLALVMGACGITQVQIVIVVTATPGGTIDTPITNIATSTPLPTLEISATAFPTATIDLSATPPPAAPTADGAGQAPASTELPPGFPTPVRAQVQVAEQLYEGGRMFWLQPTGQIWVLVITGEGRGTWSVYQDNYVDGTDVATDPAIVPPEGRLQPERGFGKLWRESPDVRAALGWAVTPEFGYISDYAYQVSGTDANGSAVGYHVIYSLYGEQFRFNEIDGTWQLGGA
ncbi:MAG: hypothetical protein SGI73_08570 [Chloroflexota bacterium]|nr:hypothetical protein [Chloroflexota bacterium]